MRLVVRFHRCEGCNRIAYLGKGAPDRQLCSDTDRMERQRPVYFYHRFIVVLYGLAVAVCSGVLIGLTERCP